MNKTLSAGLKQPSGRKSATDLTVLGAYPPPFGGVTVHALRLLSQFRTRNLAMRIYNLNSESESRPDVISLKRNRLFRTLKVVLSRRHPNILVMNRQIAVWLLVSSLGRLMGKRVVIRLQGVDILDWKRQARIKWFSVRICLRLVSGWVCVNDDLARAIQDSGVDADRIFMMPGYLPPAEEEVACRPGNTDVQEFIERSDPVLCANGKVASYRGEDLYGLDLLIEMTGGLVGKHPRIGLVLCLDIVNESDLLQISRLRQRAKDLRIQDNIMFDVAQGFFVPTLRCCDLFVRPTNTDGDANSIREALALGIKVIASDAVRRPHGVVLFRNRDSADLIRKVEETLSCGREQQCASLMPAGEDERIGRYISFLCGQHL